ncbi:MAG: aldolase/citrate lyase family protein [Woeseiaceae bacterium]|nr:aldolase/citrate lyase family protein [Woeseiaceae bacterium]
MSGRIDSFRRRLVDREPLIGTFMKTPFPVVAEVLGMSSLDVVVIDTEHAPFGRVEQDLCLGTLRSADMPSVVRVADDSATQIRNALDSGATGIMVPHVTSAAQAESIVRAAHFGDGGRGYAGSPRAAGYGQKSMSDHLADSARQTTIILQIEDIPALERVEEIAAVEGVDCLFVGRVDLAVAMQKGVFDDAVVDAVEGIVATCTATGTAVGMFTPDLDEIPGWTDKGTSLYLLSSDQTMLLAGANQLAATLKR